MSAPENPETRQKRQQLRRRLSRSVAYTTPLLMAVTGAAGLHGVVSDIGDGRLGTRADRTSIPEPASRATDEAPAATPEGMPEGVPEGMPEGAPEGLPEGLPEATPEGMPEGVPEGIPEGMPEADRADEG